MLVSPAGFICRISDLRMPHENNGGLKHQISAVMVADAVSGAPAVPALGHSREVTHLEGHHVKCLSHHHASCQVFALMNLQEHIHEQVKADKF